eukprot:gb/GECH01003596.1/.p1 GENE.gb/GECH01003596.1/~~gb/GECH01003596.1/.p1  ORF type:complete len:444 (+),score=142.41 gb/GECH01003596.1/:1-1332(+)
MLRSTGGRFSTPRRNALKTQRSSPFSFSKRGLYEDALTDLKSNKEESSKNPLLPEFVAMPSHTTEDIIGFIRKNMGPPKQVQSKYPHLSIEDVTSRAKQIMAREIPELDDEYKAWLKSLGFTTEDVELMLHGKIPEFVREDGRLDWDVVANTLGSTDQEFRLWKSIGDLWKDIEQPKAAENVKIDWDYISQELGEECARENQKLLEKEINSIEKIDGKAISQEFSNYLEPVITELKDEVADNLDHMDEVTDEIERFAQFPKDTANQMMHMDEFLDKYAPEVRYNMDKEIEEENYDFEYKDTLKELGTSIEDQTFTKERFRELYAEGAQASGSSGDVSVSTQDRKLKELQEQQERVKTLEGELQRMKSGEDEAQQDDESKGKKEEDPETLDLIEFGREFLAEQYPSFKAKKEKSDQQKAEKAKAKTETNTQSKSEQSDNDEQQQ